MLLVVHIHIRVRPDAIDAFKAATLENARLSLHEKGIARFDLVQQLENPTMFVLVEAYRDNEAPGLHKTTAHYLRWRDAVEPMMAEPRRRMEFASVFPEDQAW